MADIETWRNDLRLAGRPVADANGDGPGLSSMCHCGEPLSVRQVDGAWLPECRSGCSFDRIVDEIRFARERRGEWGSSMEPPGASRDAAFPLLSIDDLASLPAPSYLLRDFIAAGAFNVLYGPSGVGKSFLALDWSLCIAAGLPWYGQEAAKGPVVYVAAEGVAGLYPRIAAWQRARGTPKVDGIRFIAQATNLLDEKVVQRVQRTLHALPEPPALVVWDTLARSMVGGDENAARDVGLAIEAADWLAGHYGAARLFVHHTGKNGEDERGSSALRGACDVMLAVKPHEPGMRLTCEKAKDAEKFEPWNLHLLPTADSCVIGVGTVSAGPTEMETRILESVSASFGTDLASATSIRDASGVPKTSLHRALHRLVEGGFLAKDTSAAYPRYAITADGIAQTVPNRSKPFHGTAANRSVPPPSLKGWNAERFGPETASADALLDHADRLLADHPTEAV